jgi:hypothetical protein
MEGGIYYWETMKNMAYFLLALNSPELLTTMTIWEGDAQ